jgi:hypothetical protein
MLILKWERMAEYHEPVGRSHLSRSRLGSGVELLERWADGAGQVAKNAMYQALFAVLDGSVFQSYDIVDDSGRENEFTVIVKDDLIVRVCFHEANMFGISFIGHVGSATP